MDNNKTVGKYIIVKDLSLADYMKDKEGNVCVYDTKEEALIVCGMYEFENVLILKVENNYTENI